MLSVRNLDAGYGVVQVLWQINMEVHQGEITALIGSNGMGKTTLLEKLIVSDIQAGRGCALVDPHGDRIPDVEGPLQPGDERPLTGWPAGVPAGLACLSCRGPRVG